MDFSGSNLNFGSYMSERGGIRHSETGRSFWERPVSLLLGMVGI